MGDVNDDSDLRLSHCVSGSVRVAGERTPE